MKKSDIRRIVELAHMNALEAIEPIRQRMSPEDFHAVCQAVKAELFTPKAEAITSIKEPQNEALERSKKNA